MSDDLMDLLRTTTAPSELVRFGRYCSEKAIEPGFFTEAERRRYLRNANRVPKMLRDLGHDEAARLFDIELRARKTLGRQMGLTNGALNTIEIERDFCG